MDSDNDIPRDPASGQFTSATDHYDVTRGDFVPLQDRPRDEDSAPIYDRGSDDDKVRAAAAERIAQQGMDVEEPTAVEWFKKDADGRLTEEHLEPNVSITIDQAADGLSAFRAQNDAINELSAEQDLIDAVDQARAAANGQQYTPADTPPAPTVEANTAEATPTTDGLPPELATALDHPLVRQAIESQMSEAVAAKEQYAQAVEQANYLAQANLLEHLPELSRIPDKNQWEGAIRAIHAQDPARVNRALNTISRVQQLSAESARIQNERTAQMQAQTKAEVEKYSRSENARFDAYAAKENLNVPEMGRAAQQYFHSELGVSPDSLKLLIEETPALRSAAFQRLIVDAVRYNQGKIARQNLPRNLPPAPLRPGSQVAAPSYSASKVAGLERALANATGHTAIKIAAQITSLKRKG
jgi:hypothetical protein